MEKYLTSLLEMNNRVIIPDLGAFILRQQEPKELVFNDLLAFDDGLLTDRLIQEENLSKAEAQNRVRQFVERLKSALQKGETCRLENLGSLKMDASSRISLEAESEKEREAKAGGGDSAPEEPAPEAPVTMPRKKKTLPENEKRTAGTEESKKGETQETGTGDTQADEFGPAKAGKAKTKKAKPRSAGPKTAKAKTAKPKPAQTGTEKDKASETDEDNGEVAGKAKGNAAGEGAEVGKNETTGPESPAEKEVESLPADAEAEAGFELEEEDASLVSAGDDAARMEVVPDEDVPVKAGTEEEPPFQIDDSAEDKHEETDDQTADPFEGIISAEESGSDESMTIEELMESEQRKFKVQVDGVPVSMEAEETSFSGYSRPRRRRAWPWIAGILVLIAAFLLAGWFLFPERLNRMLPAAVSQRLFKETPAGEIPMQETGEQEGTVEPADAEEQVDLEETDNAGYEEDFAPASGESAARKDEAGTSAVPTGTGSKKYYVVAGCFADIRNAENYVRILRDQGYDASIFGKRDNLHAVCFSSHASRQAAQEELSRVRNAYDASAWLLFY